jgi:hypothetical protein
MHVKKSGLERFEQFLAECMGIGQLNGVCTNFYISLVKYILRGTIWSALLSYLESIQHSYLALPLLLTLLLSFIMLHVCTLNRSPLNYLSLSLSLSLFLSQSLCAGQLIAVLSSNGRRS